MRAEQGGQLGKLVVELALGELGERGTTLSCMVCTGWVLSESNLLLVGIPSTVWRRAKLVTSWVRGGDYHGFLYCILGLGA